MFLDKEVDKKVKYKLGIFDGREPLEEELSKVDEILLTNVNAKGEKIGTDISELTRLPKLQALDLKGFTLTEELLETINRLSELVSLSFHECQSTIPLELLLDKLKSLLLSNCGRVDLSKMELPETVIIINGEMVDISNLKLNNRLEDLEIKNTEIFNSEELLKLPKLSVFNADGSTLDNTDVIKELKNKKVAVSNSLEYNPIR